MNAIAKTLFVSKVTPKGKNQFDGLDLDKIIAAGGFYVKRVDDKFVKCEATDAEGIEIPYTSYEAATLADIGEVFDMICTEAMEKWGLDADKCLNAANSNADLVLNKAVRDFYSNEEKAPRGEAAKANAQLSFVINNAGSRLMEIAGKLTEFDTAGDKDGKRKFIEQVYSELKAKK